MGFTVPLLFDRALYDPGGAIYQGFAAGLLGATVIGGAMGVWCLRSSLEA
jgi:hypothetical protein